MRFLVDQNVDDAVAGFLRDAGYEVLKVREIVAATSPDVLIAFIAESEGLIIISHDSDFKELHKLLPGGFRKRVRSGAGVVHLQMKNSYALARVQASLTFIEFCHQEAIRNQRRMQVRLTSSTMTMIDNTRFQ